MPQISLRSADMQNSETISCLCYRHTQTSNFFMSGTVINIACSSPLTSVIHYRVYWEKFKILTDSLGRLSERYKIENKQKLSELQNKGNIHFILVRMKNFKYEIRKVTLLPVCFNIQTDESRTILEIINVRLGVGDDVKYLKWV